MPDPTGTECADADGVKEEAIRAAGEMLSDQGLKVWTTGRWDMFVCDELNRTQLKPSFNAEDLTGELTDDQE